MSSETCDNDGTLRRITRRYAIASDAVEPLIDGANETGRGDDVWQDEDNRHRRRRTFIQKATVTYNEPVAGTHLITVEGVHYVNTGEQRGGGAAVRTITREFQKPPPSGRRSDRPSRLPQRTDSKRSRSCKCASDTSPAATCQPSAPAPLQTAAPT